MKITISEALGWMKILKDRRADLVLVRNANSNKSEVEYNGRVIKTEPQYDAKKLDKTITGLSREIRLLDMAIKKANAKTVLDGYEQDDKVLGELED